MISADDFIYVHVPITDGHWPERILKQEFGAKMIFQQHSSAAVHDRTKLLFGFVRNPYSWEYAYWKHCNKTSGWPEITFSDWVKFRYIDEDFSSICSKYTFEDSHFNFLTIRKNLMVNPQAGMFCDPSGDCVANLIFKYEFYKENWEEFFRMQGKFDLEIDNLIVDNEYKNNYDDFIYQTVTQFKQIDLNTFGYSFDDNGENWIDVDYQLNIEGSINKDYCFNRDFVNL